MIDLKHENLNGNIFVLRSMKEFIIVRFEQYKLVSDLPLGEYKALRLINSSSNSLDLNQKVKIIEENGNMVCLVDLQRNMNRHIQGTLITDRNTKKLIV